MKPPIDFWFDFISPYGYFASLQIGELAARHGRSVRWRPLLLGVTVMKVMGLKPLMDTPLKRDYVLRDVRRHARGHGIALGRDLERAPMNPLPAARTLAWLDKNAREHAATFARKLLHRYWVEGVECDQADVLRLALHDAAVDAQTIEQALGDGTASELLRSSVAEAIAAGAFGSPFVLIDGEPFWGVDKLPLADKWLATGGW
jgi:2-hydroxychromene-2-carboxylate isomerase